MAAAVFRLQAALRAALAGALLLAAAAASAQGPAPGAASGAHASRPPGIDWFEGDVADAFAKAASVNKPVFLYWGAVWCPPCLELKASLFKRQDFRDRLQLFVPVYLDGDAAGAQAWGERFHISGYPTVLVLRADRTELERVSGGMDLSRYAEVLELALGQGQPVQELLKAGSATASADDCRRLAYNGWMLDDAWSEEPGPLGTLAAQLSQAAERCPTDRTIERARLQMTAVHAAVLSETKALAGGAAPSAALQELLDPVPGVLADRDLAQAVGDTLEYMPAEFFAAAAPMFAPQNPKRGREILLRFWSSLMDRLAEDTRYSAADRLNALRSKALAAKALSADGKVPAALAGAVSRRIDEALTKEHEPYARAALVNSALNALDVLGDDGRAHDILAGEIKTSANAYYYMADLGELEEKFGHTDVAIGWLARSYREAQGPATRFQWGVGYVRGLVRMRPQDDAAIREAALAVLGDLDASGDLHGRTLRSLKRLETSLRDWNKGEQAQAQHAAAIDALRQRMQAICGKLPADDSSQPACAGFLAEG